MESVGMSVAAVRRCLGVGFAMALLTAAGCVDGTLERPDTGAEIQNNPVGDGPVERAVYLIPDAFGEPSEPGRVVTYREVDGQPVSGDLMFPKRLLKPLDQVGDRRATRGSSNRTKRHDLVAETENDPLWSGGRVPYEIDASFNSRDREEILDAIEHWNRRTPIQLVEHDGEQDYVRFTLVDRGCRSFPGRIGGEQKIKLSEGCDRGSVIHEIGHAVGLHHEHTRPDRDQHVRIAWDNIEEGADYQFEIQQSGKAIGPYDFTSVMHYGSHAYSKNGQQTIVRKNGPPDYDTGDEELSSSDREGVRQLYSDGTATGGCDEVERLAGDHRYGTAVEVSESLYPSGANRAILVEDSDRNPDALTSGPLARSLGAPILLTGTDDVPHPTMTELKRLGVETVHLVGGTAVVSENVRREVENSGMQVRRHAGSTRYGTAEAVARETGTSDGLVYVASGADLRFAEALVAGAAAASLGAPLLLVQKDSIPTPTRRALSDLGVSETVVVGRNVSISDEVLRQLPNPTRIGGLGKYAIAVEVARDAANRSGSVSTDELNLARGDKSPDALAAGATGRPLLLSPPEDLDADPEAFLEQVGSEVVLFGGTEALSRDAELDVCSAVDGSSTASSTPSCPATAETCNGKDDDCDGETDEDALTRKCSNQQGVCAGSTTTCSGGGYPDCGPGQFGAHYETDETRCDGRDNDCDGETDENLTRSCGSSTGACRPGTETCSSGSWGTCQGGVGPSSEQSDGKDNDCDGTTDENVGSPPTTSSTSKDPGDTCNSDAECRSEICTSGGQCAHRIFVTRREFDGDFGGIAGTDTACAKRAKRAGIVRGSGDWDAVIGSESRSGVITGSIRAPVYNMNGDKVADGRTDFWDGDHDAQVRYDPYGKVKYGEVWTGMDARGTGHSSDCEGWTTAEGNRFGTVGNSCKADGYWAHNYSFATCSSTRSLYCLQD